MTLLWERRWWAATSAVILAARNRPCSASWPTSSGLLRRQCQQGHQALQHQHRVQVPGNVLQQIDLRVGQAGVAAHERLQPAFLLLVGPLAEQHHPHHVQEGHADQFLDVDAAVAEQADVALHIRYGGFPDDDAGQIAGINGFLSVMVAFSKVGTFSQYRPAHCNQLS